MHGKLVLMNQSASDNNQSFYSIGGYTLSVMITLIAALFFYKLTRHNVYFLFLIVWLFAHIGVFLFASKFLNRFITPKLRVGLFVVATLICIMLVIIVRTPFTVISVGVRTAPISVEFVLIPYGDRTADKPRSFFASRGAKNINVEFVMPAAFQDSRNPSVMYFGSYDRPYDVYRLSYGAEFLFWRIPLASFEGADLMKVIGVDEQNSLIFDGTDARLSSQIRSKPTLQIKFERFSVLEKSGKLRRALFMLLWLFVLLLVSAAMIWSDWTKKRIYDLRVKLNVRIKT